MLASMAKGGTWALPMAFAFRHQRAKPVNVGSKLHFMC
jgi:hypothetical protein